MKKILKNCLFVVALTILCGGVFPLALAGLAQLTMPHQANGSLIYAENVVVGSELVGQNFEGSDYFWGRPSRVAYNMDKNASGSGSNNYSVSDPQLEQRIVNRIEGLSLVGKDNAIPTDLVTESGSGLDPHISYESARIQVPRISQNTGISESELIVLIDKHTDNYKLTHVMNLNLDLYELRK